MIDDVVTSYTEIVIPWRKTDQYGDGTFYDLHDNPVQEPLVLPRAKLVEWMEYL